VLAGLGNFAFLDSLPPVSAAEAQPGPNIVRYSPDIEPLVRVLEDTSHDKLMETVAARVRAGTSYQQLLSAVLLAGVRRVKPRPVGFQFHAVLVINSAHLASVASNDRDRWLPLFWSIDNFKRSQLNPRKGNAGWVLPALNNGVLPAATQARNRFIAAMDSWDEEGADRAITALVRNAGASELIELFWRYGARDFRDIGHKAIYAANSWRVLQTVGWRHAEPVMRSLAFAMLEHPEKGNPAKMDYEPDRPWRENIKKAAKIRQGWQNGQVQEKATTEMLTVLRNGTYSAASDRAVQLLNKGIDPSCVWDALFLMAGELLMRYPGIVGIHCVTSVNALHYGYQTSGNDETRRMLMLQCAAFLTMFRSRLAGSKVTNNLRVETLQPIAMKATGAEAMEEIFSHLPKDRVTSARKTMGYLAAAGPNGPQTLMAAARRLVFNKGNDSHDYKFSSAALEDFYNATPTWRTRYLATSMFNLHGTGEKDTNLMTRVRAALAKT
jgi:hypothetical protein